MSISGIDMHKPNFIPEVVLLMRQGENCNSVQRITMFC